MTYSEIRSAYEIAETFDREVYIGKKKKKIIKIFVIEYEANSNF